MKNLKNLNVVSTIFTIAGAALGCVGGALSSLIKAKLLNDDIDKNANS